MQELTLKHTDETMIFQSENHDNCTVCNRPFTNREMTHLGYKSNSELVNVGNCCSSVLQETIIRHSFMPRPYSIPSADTVLWRFMDFPKFVSLLKTKSLFFTRADKFEDPFEGAKGIMKNKAKWNDYYRDFFFQACSISPAGVQSNRSEAEILANVEQLEEQFEKSVEMDLRTTFINCWHENAYESEAMWKLYTSTLSQGIAIKSSHRRLNLALGRRIAIGRVNYIDYSTSYAGINECFWFKRKSFEHEREVRALVSDHSREHPVGKLVPVDLDMLIEKIYVSPTAQNWFEEIVQDILLKYGLNKEIAGSSLNEM